MAVLPIPICRRANRWHYLVAIGLFWASIAPLSAQPARTAVLADSTVVPLRSGRLVLTPGTTAEFFAAASRGSAGGAVAFAEFSQLLSRRDRELLAQRGLSVLSYLRGRVYRVLARAALARHDTLLARLLRLAAPLRPQDRVEPPLWRLAQRAPAAADTLVSQLQPDGRLLLRVTFRVGTPDSAGPARLAAFDADAQRLNAAQWRVAVRRSSLPALAAIEGVEWIEPDGLRIRFANDNTRREADVDALQNFSVTSAQSLGSGGAGIQVGVFDSGIDIAHNDFSALTAGVITGTRVVLPAATVSMHGTLVAGIIAGNGYNSAAQGGTAFQWRGMAPEAELLDANIDAIGYDRPVFAETVRKLIVVSGMDASNHSYPAEPGARYSQNAAQRDSMIRGDATTGDGSAIPARAQVYSAGNNGGATAAGPSPDGMDHSIFGYFSLNPGETKNAIQVGSWSSALHRIVGSSSLGPTWDGRLKPDVVAPGSNVKTAGFWTGAVPAGDLCSKAPDGLTGSGPWHNIYMISCGTSLAAPVVTGTLADLLQVYATTMNVDVNSAPPLPSTLRAILLHTAHDVEPTTAPDPLKPWLIDGATLPWFSNTDGEVRPFAGPDVATGYGLIDANDAATAIANRLFLEDVIDASCDSRTYTLRTQSLSSVFAPDPVQVKVTLAWDDAAADPLTAETDPHLVNDLDLVLIDPGGAKHYPWRVNQVVTDEYGTALSGDQESCTGSIVVKPQLAPPGPIPAADLAAAHSATGTDHLNNVEQVVATGPAGNWKVVVSGFRLADGPQKFSLVGVPAVRMVYTNPRAICSTLLAACVSLFRDVCRKYPEICKGPRRIPFGPRGPQFLFRDALDRIILPLGQACAALEQSSCGAPGNYEIAVRSPIPLGLTLYASTGQRVAATNPAATTRLRYRSERGLEYFLIVSPPASVRVGRVYDVLLSIRRLDP